MLMNNELNYHIFQKFIPWLKNHDKCICINMKKIADQYFCWLMQVFAESKTLFLLLPLQCCYGTTKLMMLRSYLLLNWISVVHFESTSALKLRMEMSDCPALWNNNSFRKLNKRFYLTDMWINRKAFCLRLGSEWGWGMWEDRGREGD